MRVAPIVMALALLTASGALAPAVAQEKQAKPKRPVIIYDPSALRRPPPQERTYVGPGPSLSPPMERIPNVPPLAQPPIR